MRVAIEGDGFGAGTDVCLEANQICATLTESLAGRLAAFAGMAGDDSSSVAFAEPYDAAAATALTTLAGLTDAFAGVGRLVEATGRNHAQAESAALEQRPVALYDGAALAHEHYLHVSIPAPPSALGATTPGLSREQQWILDHVEGFVWPGADVDRLREAALRWRLAAGHVGDLLDQCDLLSRHLGRQTSPEIPLALDAVDELRGHVGTVIDQLADLADSCEDYADRVQAAHDALVALLREILAMIVEGVVIAVVVSAVTAGAGAGVATGATIARIAAQSPRFRRIAETLTSLAAYAGTRARRVDDALVALRPRIERFKAARVRDERGSMDWSILSKWRRVDLTPFERMGGHTLERHLGRSVESLAERAQRRNIPFASSFHTRQEAESIIGRVIGRHEDKIEWWLQTDRKGALRLDDALGSTGISVDQLGVMSRHVGRDRVTTRSDL